MLWLDYSYSLITPNHPTESSARKSGEQAIERQIEISDKQKAHSGLSNNRPVSLFAPPMKSNFNRREFLAASTTIAAGLGLGLTGNTTTAAAANPAEATRLMKAMIRNHPKEDDLKKLKDAGFDGVEAGIIDPAEAEKCRATAEKLGMRIHSVLRGWAEFNSRDADKVQKSLAVTENALRAAQGFGADAILLVPCRIGGIKMPRPWEFLLEFNDKTGHLTRVVYGDNAPYAEYINAHNHAVDTSTEMIKRLIPLAEKTGVVIALENVWNNLWVKPAIFKHFVASFQSKWVKAYYDIGNHVKYFLEIKYFIQ